MSKKRTEKSIKHSEHSDSNKTSSTTAVAKSNLYTRTVQRVRAFVLLHRQASIGVLAGVVVLGVTGGIVTKYWEGPSATDSQTPIVVQNVEAGKEPPLHARKLDGVIVSEDQPINSVPITVMIENLAHPSVRPQAGLSRARIVHELPAEGSIERFLAVFLPEDLPEVIGPIRSSRHYYLEFQGEYDNAPYAHAGGSPEAMQAIDGLGVRDISAIGKASRYFYRGEGGSPHNLFTTNTLMQLMLRDLGFEYEPNYASWEFRNEEPKLDKRPSTQEVVIDWASGTSYDARYVYDREKNEYLRFHGDEPHTDRNTGEQIRVKNIAIQRIPQETYLPSGKGRVDLNITGEGEGWVIRDGKAIYGQWKKPSRLERIRWFDDKGKEISFQRGITWVHTVPGDRAVTITPEPNIEL